MNTTDTNHVNVDVDVWHYWPNWHYGDYYKDYYDYYYRNYHDIHDMDLSLFLVFLIIVICVFIVIMPCDTPYTTYTRIWYTHTPRAHGVYASAAPADEEEGKCMIRGNKFGTQQPPPAKLIST